MKLLNIYSFYHILKLNIQIQLTKLSTSIYTCKLINKYGEYYYFFFDRANKKCNSIKFGLNFVFVQMKNVPIMLTETCQIRRAIGFIKITRNILFFSSRETFFPSSPLQKPNSRTLN